MGNTAGELARSLETGFIDADVESNEAYRPDLLLNDYHRGSSVAAHICNELSHCDSFLFSVVFLTMGGIEVILQSLEEARLRGVKGRILTTDYLMFNHPRALRRILQFDNIDVRIYTKEDFHTKGYLFHRQDQYTLVVGSSNMTQNALRKNKEWNLKVTSMEQGELIQSTVTEFEAMWRDATPLTLEWINEVYEPDWKKNHIVRNGKHVSRLKTYTLTPNSMQTAATKNLENLREQGEDKALLISATGTGKTYLSAFDVRNCEPKKMLFLVHREQILQQAMDSFKDVLGEDINAGMLTGEHHEDGADYLFATIQTMSKDEILHHFAPDYFDYIVIDETHKAGAESYRKVIDYYKPHFMLGMTASPERTDGYDIYQLFDHNIAYEIRLQQAMEEDLLCPFHYFGITDLTVDGQEIDDTTEFCNLVSSQRVDYIVDRITFYGHSGSRVKGLMFCSTVKEAEELSRLLNKRGYQTLALSGADSQSDREQAIKRLEQDSREGRLDYILTVDIFNEGIDIPEVNQVVMLRPTQSAIIFVQQLGRGLRKCDDKDFVVIIDFIGNYNKNFLIPIALSGDRTYNKDTIRKYVAQGNRMLPGCSTINFDAIAKEKIYESINTTNFTTLKLLKEEYRDLKAKLGKVPSLMDFYQNGAVDPSIIIDYAKSYHNFLKKVDKEYDVQMTDVEEKMLEFVSVYLSSGKRPHELLILKMLLEQERISKSEITEELKQQYHIVDDEASVNKALEILQGGFLSGSDKTNYSQYMFIEPAKDDETVTQAMFQRCMLYYRSIQNKAFIEQLKDVIDYGLQSYQDKYSVRYLDTNLSLYQKYSRKDVCRLLNWKSDESSVVYGYKVKYGTCPIFVTYNKSEDISGSTKYEDQFIDKSIFSWMTRSRLTIQSEEVQKILRCKQSGLKIHLFVKKADGEGKDFYYLGETEPMLNAVQQMTMQDDKGKSLSVVNIPMKLKNSVRDDVYEYIVG